MQNIFIVLLMDYIHKNFSRHKYKRAVEFNKYNEIYIADMAAEINMGAISPGGKCVFPVDLYSNGKSSISSVCHHYSHQVAICLSHLMLSCFLIRNLSPLLGLMNSCLSPPSSLLERMPHIYSCRL